jgi:hypothetical protein
MPLQAVVRGDNLAFADQFRNWSEALRRCRPFVLLDHTAVSRCHPSVPRGFDRMIGVLMRSYGARAAEQCA